MIWIPIVVINESTEDDYVVSKMVNIESDYTSRVDTDNNPYTRQPIEGQGLPTDCWPHLDFFAERVEGSFGQLRSEVSSAR